MNGPFMKKKDLPNVRSYMYMLNLTNRDFEIFYCVRLGGHVGGGSVCLGGHVGGGGGLCGV